MSYQKLSKMRLGLSFCAIIAGFYVCIGVTNALGMCRKGGPLVPNEAGLLEKTIPEMISIGFPNAGMNDIQVARGAQSKIVVLPRFSSGLFRAMFAMKEIWNGKEIHRRISA